MKRNRHFLLSLLLTVALLLPGCGQNTTPVSQTGFYFDTVVTITLYDTDRPGAPQIDALFEGCFALCRTYEDMLSRTKEGSDIWNLNHAKGAPVEVRPETAALLRKALSYCEATEGIVDITVAPLSELWDFSSENLPHKSGPSSLPSESQIESLLSHVDYRNIRIDGNTVTLSDPCAAVDLGCIAKGYIADQLKRYLKEQGVRSAILNLGGNVLTIGGRPDGSAFRLGIQKPFAADGAPAAVLDVTDASLVSSGVYERYFELDGTRYHHLLSTATGRPENNGLTSVTILSASSADGDILSTACFLLGPEKGMAYAESLPGIEALFITEDGALHPTSGLSGLLQTP